MIKIVGMVDFEAGVTHDDKIFRRISQEVATFSEKKNVSKEENSKSDKKEKIISDK